MARYYFFEHPEIPHEAPCWVLEGRRLVLFENKVTHPSEPIPRQWNCQEVNQAEGEQKPDQQDDGKGCSDYVESPVGLIGMLGQIERIKLFECLILHYK